MAHLLKEVQEKQREPAIVSNKGYVYVVLISREFWGYVSRLAGRPDAGCLAYTNEGEYDIVAAEVSA